MSRYVFYLGGPHAVVSECDFWETGSPHTPGCIVAREVGAKIPASAYEFSEPSVSQDVLWERGRNCGFNATALLPLEV